MSSKIVIAFFIVKIFSDILALIELPQVEKNNILETDTRIRETTNKLFSILKLKVSERPTLKQYSLIHNYLVSTSLQDYTNLMEIAKLTRVDKTKSSNQTLNFMTILNEILNDDIELEIESEDQYVIRHIEGFLENLDKYTDTYNYTDNNVDILLAEVLKLLEKNKTFMDVYYHNDTFDSDTSWLESSDEKENLINENEFWEPSGRRIYQGRKANIKDFPFIASIQIFNHFQCAGSIIKSDLIITAASCLQLAWNNRFFRENPAFLSARVGSTFHNGGGENIPVLEVYFHPAYNPKSLKNNLCILRLLRVLKFKRKGRRIKKIDIDRRANPLPSITDGITIVGWGARQSSNIIVDPYLSFAVLDFYDLRECQDVYSKEYVTKTNFCAGFISHGGGACNRDVGGPGIIRGILGGVVSFGSPLCGSPDAPTVFTKLGYYAEWIETIMEEQVPEGKKRTTTLPPFQFFTVPTSFEQTKTTFKIRPPIFSSNAKTDEGEEALRMINNQKSLKDFITTLVGSKEIDNFLREASNFTKTKPRESQPDRIPFTYSPVTTLEPPEFSSTAMSNMDAVDSSKVSLHKSFEGNEKNSIKDTDSEKYVIDHKDKELDAKLERDIVEILDNINLEDYYNTEKEPTDIQSSVLRNDNDGRNKLKNTFTLLYLSDNNEKDFPDGQTDEDSYSNESGLEIDPDLNTDVNYKMNESEDLLIPDSVLVDIVSEAFKEELEKNNTRIGEIRNSTCTNFQNNTCKQEFQNKAPDVENHNKIKKRGGNMPLTKNTMKNQQATGKRKRKQQKKRLLHYK